MKRAEVVWSHEFQDFIEVDTSVTAVAWSEANQAFVEVDGMKRRLTGEKLRRRDDALEDQIADEYMTLRAAAAVFGCHNSTVYRHMAGRLGRRHDEVSEVWSFNRAVSLVRANAVLSLRRTDERVRNATRLTEGAKMSAWSWPMGRLDRTKKTRARYLVGKLPLEPTPAGVRCEVWMILQQWGESAAAPYSWCIDLMKYGTDASGRSTGPFLEPGTRRIQHVQLAESDWPAYFGPWGAMGEWLLGELARLKEPAPPIPVAAD